MIPQYGAVSYTHLKGIHPVVHREMRWKSGGFRQVYHTYQRVQCSESEESVVLVYRVQFNNFFHKVLFFSSMQM